MFNRILVPLDGSTFAERVIPHAEHFARIFGSNIILLQVLDPTTFSEGPNPVDPLDWQIRKTEAEIYLNGVATRIQNKLVDSTAKSVDNGEVNQRVDYAIREGKPAENIINYAHAENIDLVVMSTHGAGGLSRWNISSVTQKVINLIYLPLLLIRAYTQPGAEEPESHYRRILLPIDSSRRAESTLSVGIELARGGVPTEPTSGFKQRARRSKESSEPTNKTKLILTAVIKPPEFPIPKPYPVEIEKLIKQVMAVSRLAVSNYLNEMKERLPVECETCVLENISVATAIHDKASREDDIDLVVLCAHGFTGQFTWPYGSVARNYIDHGTKPVLVIQDVPHTQAQLTAAEKAAKKTGGR